MFLHNFKLKEIANMSLPKTCLAGLLKLCMLYKITFPGNESNMLYNKNRHEVLISLIMLKFSDSKIKPYV